MPSGAWVTFNADWLTGRTGCNELSRAVDRTSRSPDVTTTDRASTGESAEVETAILTTLGAEVIYTIDHIRLTLMPRPPPGLASTSQPSAEQRSTESLRNVLNSACACARRRPRIRQASILSRISWRPCVAHLLADHRAGQAG